MTSEAGGAVELQVLLSALAEEDPMTVAYARGCLCSMGEAAVEPDQGQREYLASLEPLERAVRNAAELPRPAAAFRDGSLPFPGKEIVLHQRTGRVDHTPAGHPDP